MAAPQRKPQADIYTVLLAIAFIAIITAVVFLYLETADYGTNKYSGAPPVARVDATDATTSLADAESGRQMSRPRVSVSPMLLGSLQSLAPNP
jgi:hypothetical protein